MRRLLDLVESDTGSRVGRRVNVHPTTLVVRGSSGPPRRGARRSRGARR
jgi:hypothetical protein